MRYSYSRIDCWKKCPYQYKLRYVDKLKTLPDQKADNALYLGTAIHTGFETGSVEEAIKDYRSHYYIITDENITEEIKLEYLIPKALELLPEAECEVEIKTDNFIGYIDRLVYLFTDEQGIKHYEIWDYKYSNAIDRYLESGQLHLYKYYFEKTNPNVCVDHLRYVFIPKVSIRQKLKAKPPETLTEFRERVKEHLDAGEIKIVEIVFDSTRIQEFEDDCKRNACSVSVGEFPKNPTRLCNWCEYQQYCESEGQIDWMIINK